MRSKLVFCNDDGSPLSLWQLHKRLQMVCLRAGQRKIRWHDLRHTCASWMVQAGIPLYTVAQMLGHSSTAVTQRYAHLRPQHLADAIAKLA